MLVLILLSSVSYGAQINRCELRGGVWIIDDDGEYYCAIDLSRGEQAIYKWGGYLFPQNPKLGLILEIIGIYIILVNFGLIPSIFSSLNNKTLKRWGL